MIISTIAAVVNIRLLLLLHFTHPLTPSPAHPSGAFVVLILIILSMAIPAINFFLFTLHSL